MQKQIYILLLLFILFTRDSASFSFKNASLPTIDLFLSVTYHEYRLQQRIERISSSFLGTPYKLGVLGEGSNGCVDNDPLYSFAYVDCTTFIEQVIACAISKNVSSAIDTLQKVRYNNGNISYMQRNHFISCDWLPNNMAAGYIADITKTIGGEHITSINAEINKKKWFEYQLKKASIDEKQIIKKVSIHYIPVNKISKIITKIPSGSFVNIVRKQHPEHQVIISHQGIAVKTKQGLVFRHAAYNDMVKDELFVEYMENMQKRNTAILGINLFRIRAGLKKYMEK